MVIDKNSFFRQATMRVCGNLDIETALWRCLEYLETVIPMAGIALFLIVRDLVTMRTIAQVTRYDDSAIMDRIISFPDEARVGLVYNSWAGIQTQDVIIFNRPELDPVTRMMTQSATTPVGRGMMKPPRRGHCCWESP